MKKKPSVYDLLQLKGKRKLVQLHVDNPEEAAAAEAVGIDLLTLEANEKLPAIRAAAPNTFIQAGPAHGTVASAEEGVRRGFAAMELGADAVYFSGSPYILEAMTREGIPVTGHVGLVPNLSTWTNYRAIGRNPEEAAQVYRKVKGLESAGAWAIEVEVIPTRIADYLTSNTRMLTEGMGCGTACDTIYLFSCDVLGTNTGHYPRHSKRYGEIASALRKVQEARIAAIREFADDIASNGYPEPKHEVSISDRVYEDFLRLVAGT
jgi:3-methyl-2-oxobutanoate hydroxymethyltransferase